MIFRKATMDDLDAVHQIYEHIHAAERAGKLTIGWDPDVYPVRQTAEDGILAKEMYVCEKDGQIVASAILNHNQCPGYEKAEWTIEADPKEILILHTLVVEPEQAGHGIGKAMIAFYEGVAKGMGCRALQLDTNAKNKVARSLYTGLGYTEIGIIPSDFNGIPNIDLVVYEKSI